MMILMFENFEIKFFILRIKRKESKEKKNLDNDFFKDKWLETNKIFQMFLRPKEHKYITDNSAR